MAEKPREAILLQHFIDLAAGAKLPCPVRWAERKPADDKISFQLNDYFCLDVCVVMLL